MSTHNIGFYEDLTKITVSFNYHQIPSNMHLISSEIWCVFDDKGMLLLIAA